MSAYAEHSRPPCPGGSPNCEGSIRIRGSKTCGACRGVVSAPTPKVRVATPEERMAFDRDRQKLHTEIARLKVQYGESLRKIEAQEQQLHVISELASGVDTFTIQPRKKGGSSEGTVVVVASDWHIEENVGAEVGGLNVFNLEIAQQRATRFFQAALRLTQLLQQDIHIDRMVLALLGDFITNDIHDAENAENNQALPTHAVMIAAGFIISGIEFLLNNSKLILVIPCHSGNHARTTHKTRFTSENGHSLEYLMYLHLAAYFRNEPRVEFIIPPGMHSYINIYGTVIRFHHGHSIKYNGGVGGIFIPANKAVAAWNRGRAAHLDVFGHFHQFLDAGSFICNGSLIGMNAFALAIKATYEPPRQALFLMDSRRGKTCVWPILVDSPKK